MRAAAVLLTVLRSTIRRALCRAGLHRLMFFGHSLTAAGKGGRRQQCNSHDGKKYLFHLIQLKMM